MRKIQFAAAAALVFWLATGTAGAAVLPKAKPEKVGLSSERLDRITSLFLNAVEDGRIAGTVNAVLRKGKIARFEALGKMDIGAGKAMGKDTLFRIFSMTKPITSTAVMILYEEGRLDLFDPVSKFIPEFADVRVYAEGKGRALRTVPPERPVTIRHLLTHTAGLTYGIWGDTPVDDLYREKDFSAMDLEGLARELAGLPLLFQPGERWNYSYATDVLARVVEVVSGNSFDEFLEARIFRPLKMTDTGFFVPEAKLDRFATVYRPGEKGLEVLEASEDSRFSRGRPRLLSGGGGLVSTAGDYLRFCQMLLNGGELEGRRILGRKTVELMLRDHIGAKNNPAAAGFGFGLGFAVHRDPSVSGWIGSRGESSWSGLYYTHFFIDPTEDMAAVMLVQMYPNDHLALAELFKRLVYAAVIE